MITTKVDLLNHKRKSDGTAPIAIRLTMNRKSKYIYIQYIHERLWDNAKKKVKKQHPESEAINNNIAYALNIVSNMVLDAKIHRSTLDLEVVKNKIKAKENIDYNSFFKLAKSHIHYLYKTKDIGSAIQYTSTYNNLYKYVNKIDKIKRNDKFHLDHETKYLEKVRNGRVKDVGVIQGKDLTFSDITMDFIKKYADTFVEQKAASTTIRNQVSFIRKIFNLAIDKKLISERLYPFTRRGALKIKATPTKKVGCNEKEIVLIENYHPKQWSHIYHAKQMYLFAFYMVGMRCGDLLTAKWSNIIGSRYYYNMRKNKKDSSIKIPDKAQEILNLYKQYPKRNLDSPYIFPYLQNIDSEEEHIIYRRVRHYNKEINKNLRLLEQRIGLEKKLTLHVARHSFASIATGKVPIDILQGMMEHSSITTTRNYKTNFDHTLKDKALEDVLKFRD